MSVGWFSFFFLVSKPLQLYVSATLHTMRTELRKRCLCFFFVLVWSRRCAEEWLQGSLQGKDRQHHARPRGRMEESRQAEQQDDRGYPLTSIGYRQSIHRLPRSDAMLLGVLEESGRPNTVSSVSSGMFTACLCVVEFLQCNIYLTKKRTRNTGKLSIV